MKNLSILEVEFLRSKCFKNPKIKFYSPVLYYNIQMMPLKNIEQNFMNNFRRVEVSGLNSENNRNSDRY